MSYSFNVKCASKAEAKAEVAAKMEEVAQSQKVHVQDLAAVVANANAAIDLLDIDETKDVVVSCNGSVGYIDLPDVYLTTAPLTQVAISCNAYLVARHVPA